ncbi:hypothetical protein GDO81_001837 [Engystomops pustulosus]|uniref:Uncharacterized protein n=1 Tax=Engystomops pustulosus TaxID=76066 RepID=A0AAV7DI84_ENGPU|nr:hypothetical protein GDO81_001837 [Engystomops pustulosus]
MFVPFTSYAHHFAKYNTYKMCWLRASFIFFLCSSCMGEITQTPEQECLVGEDCNLTCNHQFFTVNYFTYWYRIFPGHGPALLIYDHKNTDLRENKFKITFSSDRKQSILLIQNTALNIP